MKKTSESSEKFRNDTWGAKYLFRGPHCEWGVILLKPGQSMGSHGHKQVVEDFFFLEGAAGIVIDGVEYPAAAGDVFRAEPGEQHDIRNDGDVQVKLVFIKSPYLPDDRV